MTKLNKLDYIAIAQYIIVNFILIAAGIGVVILLWLIIFGVIR